jgi:hypothetical protein
MAVWAINRSAGIDGCNVRHGRVLPRFAGGKGGANQAFFSLTSFQQIYVFRSLAERAVTIAAAGTPPRGNRQQHLEVRRGRGRCVHLLASGGENLCGELRQTQWHVPRNAGKYSCCTAGMLMHHLIVAGMTTLAAAARPACITRQSFGRECFPSSIHVALCWHPAQQAL